MKIIPLKLQKNAYNIYIGYKLMPFVARWIENAKLGNYGVVVTSNRIYSLHKRMLKSALKSKRFKVIKVIDGEKAKSKQYLLKLTTEIVKADTLGRKLFLVCFGGGTLGDLGGFTAAIYKRGIPYIQIPTTFLSQIDSSIGGKTGIDIPEAKNILGAFYQPKAVFIDPLFLSTLPPEELKQGLAEAIKYGAIKDKELFYFLKHNSRKIIRLDPACLLKIITACVKIKSRIVEEDETETKGVRTILNFGHTFAHALESCLKYKAISHGEAVALGMQYAARLSLLLKICNPSTLNELTAIIKRFSLPYRIKFDYPTLYKSLSYDKKFTSGKIRMVLIKTIGEVKVTEGIKREKIRQTLKFFNAAKVDN